MPTPGIASITWRRQASVSRTESIFSYKSKVVDWQGKRLVADIALPSMTVEQARAWVGFFAALNGSFGTFLLGPTLDKAQSGVASGTPLVNGASQTGTTLLTDGWDNDTTDILKAGDWIKIGSYIYQVVQDADSGATTGPATLEIWPNLRESPADDAPILLTGIETQFRIEEIPAITYGKHHLVDPIRFRAFEAI